MLTTRYILDEAHLKYYDEKFKSWAASQPVKTIPSSLYPWTLSEKAGAVTCWPVGGTPLLPTVDFMFTETGPASGDKAPDNPSTITGVSSVKVTRCGKNLCPLVNVAVPNVSTTGVTVLVDAVSGSISISGKATANGTISFVPALVTNFLAYNTLRAGKTYTFSLSGNTPSSGFRLRLFVTTTSSSSWSSDKINVTTNNSSTYTLPNDIVTAWLRIDISQDTDFGTGCTFTVQVEEGETASEFEPYFENKYTLPLGSTYYGGTLDVASGVMTVTWHGYAFDGTENWVASSTHGTYYRYSLPIRPNKNTTDIACTHFIRVNNLDYEVQHYIIFASGIAIFTTQTTLEDFKAWLASQYAGGTPVVACYALATPYTVQLDPVSISALAQTDKYTPRVNTVYTDAESVQVGYVKSPIREEFELTQAIVGQGGEI